MTMTFTGVCAFPLTPMDEDGIDERAFENLIARAAGGGVDSLGVLGSTGNYAYLTPDERDSLAATAVAAAGDVPVMVGVGATRTAEVLRRAESAQEAGAAAILLAPVSYQPLTEDEAFGLYRDAASHVDVPVVVYDNPRTTHFTFTDELYARLSTIPGVVSVKIPGVPEPLGAAARRIDDLRAILADGTSIGVSGDGSATTGLLAGCDLWYSVIAGTFPDVAVEIATSVAAGETERARSMSDNLAGLWSLMGDYGSLRVAASAAHLAGLVREECLPRPLLPLPGAAIDLLGRTLTRAGLI